MIDDTLSLPELMLARRVSAETLHFSDGLTMPELLEQQEASAAALARLMGTADAPPRLVAYLASHVDALDAAVAERLWERFERQMAMNGGRNAT